MSRPLRTRGRSLMLRIVQKWVGDFQSSKSMEIFVSRDDLAHSMLKEKGGDMSIM